MGVLGMAVLTATGAGAADITGRQGLGGSIGTSLMIGDWEYRTHARPRLTGDAVFKYGFRPRWAFVGSFGYGWNSYTDEESWLSSPDYSDVRESLGLDPEGVEKVTVIAPFLGGVEYRFGKDVWVPYVGAGAGVYQLNVYFDGRVAEDPRTLADHRTYNFGLYGRVGSEQFLSESVAMDYELLGHILFSKDRDKFPPPDGDDTRTFGRDFLAYGGDSQFLQVRVGLRYYWGGTGGEEAGEEGTEGAEPGTEVTPETTAPAEPGVEVTPETTAPGEPGVEVTPPTTPPSGETVVPPPPPPAPAEGTPPAETAPPEVAPPAETPPPSGTAPSQPPPAPAPEVPESGQPESPKPSP
jgi:hypothetical protein